MLFEYFYGLTTSNIRCSEYFFLLNLTSACSLCTVCFFFIFLFRTFFICKQVFYIITNLEKIDMYENRGVPEQNKCHVLIKKCGHIIFPIYINLIIQSKTSKRTTNKCLLKSASFYPENVGQNIDHAVKISHKRV